MRIVQGTGPANRHGMPKLPVGQREVPNWPVLDLGIQPHIPLDKWALKINGEVENPYTLTWKDFIGLTAGQRRFRFSLCDFLEPDG